MPLQITEIHREPNIFITKGGEPILIDFGFAKEAILSGETSQTIDIIITPGYSPFEQYASKGRIGPWTDIYACAATLYFMIIGTPPPSAKDRVIKDELILPLKIEDSEITPEHNDVILLTLTFCVEMQIYNYMGVSRRPL